MSSWVLVIVSDKFYDGYGDFIFAAKMAAQLQKFYQTYFPEHFIPEVKLVSGLVGIRKLNDLNVTEEYDLSLLMLDDLCRKLESPEIKIQAIVEGPSFQSNLMSKIDRALIHQKSPVPLIMTPEYSIFGSIKKDVDSHLRYYQSGHLKKTQLERIIYTGLNKEAEEKGIILSDSLEKPTLDYLSDLPEKLRQILFGALTYEMYLESNQLSFSYSNDWTRGVKPIGITASERYLKIHHGYTASDAKNQDILMVGVNKELKKNALTSLLKNLEKDGYSKVSFYDASATPAIEEYLLGTSDIAGLHYRVIYIDKMPHKAMMSALALSGDLVGCTGDQSLGETISFSKIAVYECRDHKYDLAIHYYQGLSELQPSCASAFRLIKEAVSDDEFLNLSLKLRSGPFKEKMKLACGLYNAQQHLTSHVAYSTLTNEHLNYLIQHQIIDPLDCPFMDRPPILKLFERNDYRVLNEALTLCTHNIERKRRLCDILESPSTFSHHVPHKTYRLNHVEHMRMTGAIGQHSMNIINCILAEYHIHQYPYKPGDKRSSFIDAFNSLFIFFQHSSTYHIKALKGLMILVMTQINSEYRFFSPSGRFQGDRLYQLLDKLLSAWGLAIKTLTAVDKHVYYRQLADLIEKKPLRLKVLKEGITATILKEKHGITISHLATTSAHASSDKWSTFVEREKLTPTKPAEDIEIPAAGAGIPLTSHFSQC